MFFDLVQERKNDSGGCKAIYKDHGFRSSNYRLKVELIEQEGGLSLKNCILKGRVANVESSIWKYCIEDLKRLEGYDFTYFF